LLAELRRRLASAGLNIVLPIGATAFDEACAPVTPLRMRDLRATARGALIVGSGGRLFFDRFLVSTGGSDGAPHPLDRFTRAEVEAVIADGLGSSISCSVFYPFSVPGTLGGLPAPPATDSARAKPEVRPRAATPALPFQRLGRAAGLGDPGPLGIQIHPTYGPWWAYRALIVWDLAVPDEPAVGDGCAGCDAPCVAACPAHAVARDGFIYDLCRARRLADPACHLACAARSRCVRGPEQRYSARQLAFHMAAAMPKP
jgi:hypothetical protein